MPYTRSDKVLNVIVWVPLFMVSTASADVTVETAPLLPKLFVTTEYVPASASTKLEIVYDDEFAPEMLTPSLRHWYEKSAAMAPVADGVTLNVCDCPEDFVTAAGCVVMVGTFA